MKQAGYYRFPTIQGDTVVFTSEDDLWSVSADGGIARRLTSSASNAARPFLSPDGQWLAFVALDEGHPELYSMPASGGETRRLTHFGMITRPIGWSRDGSKILFASNYRQPFRNILRVYAISPEGGPIEEVPVGPAYSISLGPNGGTVIGRNTADLARWKRYRGGTAGNLWVDRTGSGEFEPLLSIKGNFDSPMWVGDRIYFVSDHEGWGNIYSCTPDGADLTRHTDHDEFFVRNPTTDGRRIVYHAGGDLYILDPLTDTVRTIDVDYHSPRAQRNRKFIDATKYLQSYALHPEGHSVAMVTRGKPVTMGIYSGPAVQLGQPDGVRYRLASWLPDGKRLVATSDEGGEEMLVILGGENNDGEDRLEGLDIGRPIELRVSPNGKWAAFSNQRNEIMVVDLENRTAKLVDRSRTLHNTGIAWSPDSRWLAYNHAEMLETSYLKIADVESGESWQVTEPLLHDVEPAFDPDGKYLYFLSYREFNPVYDNLHFDLGFPRGMRPYLITLQRDSLNPFLAKPKSPKDLMRKMEAAKLEEAPAADKVEIDFEGITRRIVPFPVKEGKYVQIGAAHSRVYFVSQPVEGSLQPPQLAEPQPNGTLECYNFDTQKLEQIATAMNDFDISGDYGSLAYRTGKKLRVIATAMKPSEMPGNESPLDNGWVDTARPRISITPELEWRQMFSEAWRLQRDFFWTEGMLGIDWNQVYNRYRPLLDRIGSRGELSDLIWELHGELGTSHAYESGGDYRPTPTYVQGFLGADIDFDDTQDAWVITSIVQGDAWSDQNGSPLETPGANIGPGDRIVSINGRKVTRERSPFEQLVNTAGAELSLTILPKGSDEPRTVTIKALADETPVRYREWVESNRKRVHEATNGRVGYVHVPNMGPLGYSEFHRGFLAEAERGSLIVDVRYNGGGHVSQLLLEKLSRRAVGYNLARYSMPQTYPQNAVNGPVVALTNEYAGSDGDIFSHGFKLMKLGPLVGKRTWGGVVGIWPRNPLVDGSVTTQPEFSFWFQDVQWGVENYGTDPDIEIDIKPQDHVAGRDPQLERAIEEVMKALEANPVTLPDFTTRPRLAPAALPKRVALSTNGQEVVEEG